MSCRMLGPWLAASVVLTFAPPVGAQDSLAPTAPLEPTTPIALQNELPSTLAYDSDLQTKGDNSVQRVASERDVGMWSLALIGPAAMIFIVTALGLTITLRSLRNDFRRERSLNRYWRHSAMSRASRASRD